MPTAQLTKIYGKFIEVLAGFLTASNLKMEF